MFAMRFNMVDPLVKKSLRHYYVNDEKMGYSFKIRLNYYRGHFLSVIDQFQVTVDGQEVPNETVKLCLNGKEFSPVEFDKCYTEFWLITVPAEVRVYLPGGLAEGEHKNELNMFFRSPYMPIGPDHQYMPVDNCSEAVMEIRK